LIPFRDNLRVRDFPLVTALLVAINVLVFFGWEGGARLDVDKVILYGTIPYEVTHPGKQCVPTSAGTFECKSTAELEARYGVKFPPTWKTIFASMFMHASIFHLVGNMIFLIAFGISLEAGLGRRSFALFYLVGGLVAMISHTLFDPSSPMPALGASGAISAVMGGYVMVFPKAKLMTWIIPPLPFVWGWIRAGWLIGILMGLQVIEAYVVLSSAFGSAGGGVAYFAHFGGFAVGAALVMVVLDRDSIETLRRKARVASGDEREVREKLELADGRISAESAAEAAQAYGHPATYAAPPAQAYGYPAAATAYAQPPAATAYGQPGAAPAYGQPTAAPSAFMQDPFAPPVQQPAPAPPPTAAPSALMPDPFAPPVQQPPRPPVPAQQQAVYAPPQTPGQALPPPAGYAPPAPGQAIPPHPGQAPPPHPVQVPPPAGQAPPPQQAARPRPAPGAVPRPPGC
jgi:membrane associated rhomboid family serine protease